MLWGSDYMTVYPDYYKDFECIKGDCRHNCCIGWEIDIDSDTAEFYKGVGGEMGTRLKECVDWKETCFILGEGERCPFLNEKNLCDIIIELGEEHLCGICADHPRFRNELPDRTEIGLGLTCEAAARLILGNKDKVRLVYEGESACDDGIINLRDSVIDTLQDREFDIFERIDNMLWLCGVENFEIDITQWADRLLSLEVLDDEWTKRLEALKTPVDFERYATYAKAYETEFEQLAVYFIYRHFANAPDSDSCAKRAKFAQKGELSFDRRVDIARAFSSEIEYSDENLYAIIDSL